MRGIDILDQSDLIASRGTLTGDDGAVGEEEFPNLRKEKSACQSAGSCDVKYGEDDPRGGMLLTLNQRSPYLATTFSLFAIQFRYHLHSVAE